MTALIAASALLLFAPWLLLPSRPRAADRPEVRGVYRILWWINRGYCVAMHRLVLFNEAPLPAHGPAILVANHTSGVDNFLLQAGCRRTLGFMIAEQFYHLWPLSILNRLLGCIPVRRDGRDISATRDALRALKQGRILPIFPEGRITPESGELFGEGKSGAAFLTLHANVPVIPAYIRGTPRTNNVFRAGVTLSRSRVIFGEPLDLSEFAVDLHDRGQEKAKLAALTERLMDAIKALRQRSLELEATL